MLCIAIFSQESNFFRWYFHYWNICSEEKINEKTLFPPVIPPEGFFRYYFRGVIMSNKCVCC